MRAEHFSLPRTKSAKATPDDLLRAVSPDVFGASRKRRYYFLTQAGMMQAYTLIASFVHGNALGVVLEPRIATEKLDKELLPSTWQVRIGPLTVEAAFGTEYPKEDYDAVVSDLVQFCKKHGIARGIERGEMIE